MLRKTTLGEPDGEGDGSDESEDSDGDIPEGEPPTDGDDPSGGGERGQVKININSRRGEDAIMTTMETLLCKEHDTAKVPTFPALPNLAAWEL